MDKYKELAIKYRVNDLADASIPGTLLAKTLGDLEKGASISNQAQGFLIEKGLLALLSYAKKETCWISGCSIQPAHC